MNKKIFSIILLISLNSVFAFAQKGTYTNLFDEQELRATVKFLSDDAFEGRAPGSRGGELAAKYIALKLQSLGVKPANNGSYFQPVSLVAVKADPKTTLKIGDASYNFGDEFGARLCRLRRRCARAEMERF